MALKTDFHTANIYFTVTNIMKTQLEKGESLYFVLITVSPTSCLHYNFFYLV